MLWTSDDNPVRTETLNMLSLEGFCTAQPQLHGVVGADRPMYLSKQA